jgi:ubiquinone/menaquinone biosynthesis C-methylase UbiE
MLTDLIANKSTKKLGCVDTPSTDRGNNSTTSSQHRTRSESKKEAAVKEMQAQWLKASPYLLEELETMIPNLLRAGQIKTMKCERLRKYDTLWEVEFGVENEQTGVFAQFLIFDRESRCIYLPFDVSSDIKRDLAIIARECIESPHIKLNESNRGMVFDQDLRKDINQKFDEYIWERMYPGTVFTPLENFLTHMGRYDFVRQFVNERDVIVDAACGIGYGAKYLSQKCLKVCAIDLSENSLNLGKRYYMDRKIQWMKEDVTSLPLADDSIDCYVSMETFEHLNQPEKLVEEMRRVVKPGGVGFISTPNGQSPRRKMINNPYHIKEYSYKEIREICCQFFNDIHFYGMDKRKKLVEISDSYSRFSNLLVKLR